MRTLRQICAAAILSLTLAVSVFAGDIDCPGYVSPPPLPSGTSTTSITTTVILAIVSLIK